MLTVAVMLAILTIVYVEFISKPNKTIEQLLYYVGAGTKLSAGLQSNYYSNRLSMKDF